MLPEVVPTFSVQGELTAAAASALGLRKGIPVDYRAGDQPNNAFSLNVLYPGEDGDHGGHLGRRVRRLGHAAGTTPSRVNTFVHVTHAPHVAALRRAALRERHGHPVQLAPGQLMGRERVPATTS